MMPIDVLTIERKQLYEQQSSTPEKQEKNMRQNSLQRWQEKWDASNKGRWTHRLIPRVDDWVNRKHGKVNYYLIQIFSNHACFRAYLNRFKHEQAPQYPAGYGVPANAEHVFFWLCTIKRHYPKWVPSIEGLIVSHKHYAANEVNAIAEDNENSSDAKMEIEDVVSGKTSREQRRRKISCQKKYRRTLTVLSQWSLRYVTFTSALKRTCKKRCPKEASRMLKSSFALR